MDSLPCCQKKDWANITVEQFFEPPGEARCDYKEEHSIYLSLASYPVSVLQVQGGKTYTGIYKKGDISITPASVPFFARWETQDSYLQIRINSCFIQTVARETLDRDFASLELVCEFQTRDPHLEAIAMMLHTEIAQENMGSKLYIDSVANLLALHLLRNYTTKKLQLSIYEGGLPKRQLIEVLEYINEHLDQDIKLADLAALLGMSQFHFSHLFKQSIGIAPYQYLLQQRVERAKQLLKQTDNGIVEIALQCGFNSHSHLSKQFKKLTGMTPKAHRMN